MPKVSVIIPSYNRANYISEAIDSVLNQTYQDFEIIVIDDGSTDNTKEVLSKYDNKIRYLYQKNSGASAARNLGINKAIGEYISFLDADDIWLPFKLKSQIDIMAKNQDVALIFTDIESFNHCGIVRYSLMRSQFPQETDSFKNKVLKINFNDGTIIKGALYEELIYGNFIFTPTVLINKNCLQREEYFDENLYISEDYDFWLRITQKYQVLYCNKVTARCRLTDNSLSGDFGIRPFTYSKYDGKMLEKHLKLCSKDFKLLIKKRIINSYNVAAWGYLNVNNKYEVRKLSLRSLIYNKTQVKLYIYILISFLPLNLILFIKKLRNRYVKS